MRIKETKVYTYAELSDRAKEKARDWLREVNAGDNYFAESVTDSFHEKLAALGFDVDKERGLSWSGFWNQGDGAAFAGKWRANDCDPVKYLANRPVVWPKESGGHECASNKEFHRIAAEILACKIAGLEYVSISVSNRGFFMSIDNYDHAEPEELTDSAWDALRVEQGKTRERFITAARDLAHAFYKALEAEYEYENSDEQIAETIIANEYEFTEEGERA